MIVKVILAIFTRASAQRKRNNDVRRALLSWLALLALCFGVRGLQRVRSSERHVRSENQRRALAIFEWVFGEPKIRKLTWLALGGDPAARSRRVEQFTAL